MSLRREKAIRFAQADSQLCVKCGRQRWKHYNTNECDLFAGVKRKDRDQWTKPNSEMNLCPPATAGSKQPKKENFQFPI